MTVLTAPPRHLRRTMEEIDERISTAVRGARDVLLYAMDYSAAYKHFYPNNKPSKEQWDYVRMTDVKREAHGTFLVVLSSALNHGEEPVWQVERLREYVWLLGRNDVLAEMDSVVSHPSDMPKLHAFAIHMGGRFTQAWLDEAGTERAARMAAGLPCEPGCVHCA